MSLGNLRLAVAGALCLAVLAVGCGDDDDTDTAPATTTPASADASELEGTWRTEPITLADMEGTLSEAGLEQHTAAFAKNAPVSDDPTVLTLDVGDDWDLLGQVQGGPRTKIDFDAQYEVTGDTVVVTHGAGTSNTYHWSVEEDVLELTWLEGNAPPYKGVPDEVFQRALYMTADFDRAG